jgi:hypothetical protein
VGNIEDAKVALDVIARAIDDAVYLDEDAYNQMIPLQQYTRTIEVLTSASLHPHPAANACKMHTSSNFFHEAGKVAAIVRLRPVLVSNMNIAE